MSINRTSLTSKAPLMRDPNPQDAHRAAARGWHEHGIAVFRPESLARMDWQDRELIKALANKLYGARED